MKSSSNKIIFLDRDGVINKDPQEKLYVTKWEDFEFLPGSKEALRMLNEHGYKVAIISNQAGISKGLFTKQQLDKVTKRMLEEIERSGGKISSVNYCPHKDEDNCSCRKPKTGLFEQASKDLTGSVENPDINTCYFVGDKRQDIEAGKGFGCKAILVLSGKSSEKEVAGWSTKPDLIKNNLLEVVSYIINHS